MQRPVVPAAIPPENRKHLLSRHGSAQGGAHACCTSARRTHPRRDQARRRCATQSTTSKTARPRAWMWPLRGARRRLNARVLAWASRSLPGLAVLNRCTDALFLRASVWPVGPGPCWSLPRIRGATVGQHSRAAMRRLRYPFLSPTGWWKVTTLSTDCRPQSPIAHKKGRERLLVLVMCERTSRIRSEKRYFSVSCPWVSSQVARNARRGTSMSLLRCRKTSKDTAHGDRAGFSAAIRQRASHRSG